MNCDNCKHYEWYYDHCRKWDCEVDAREVHNCFEQRETKLTQQEIELLKEIRKQTEASYHGIIDGIKKRGLDKDAVINYLREIAIVYA